MKKTKCKKCFCKPTTEQVEEFFTTGTCKTPVLYVSEDGAKTYVPSKADITHKRTTLWKKKKRR